MSDGGWIGVDLDGTLAHYDGWKGVEHIGDPVPAMVERVKAWLAAGREVRIFTARCWPLLADDRLPAPAVDDVRAALRAVTAIQDWSLAVFGRPLAITCVKDYGMIELWDDRAVAVEPNTGRPVLRPAPDDMAPFTLREDDGKGGRRTVAVGHCLRGRILRDVA